MRESARAWVAGLRAGGAVALLALLASCGEADRPQGNALHVAVMGEGAGAGSLARRMADEMTATTLIERDSAGQLVGGLASSWRFVDGGQALILRLRPVRWSDDKELVASDVIAAFRRSARPPQPAPAFRLAGISGAADVAAGRSATRLGVLAPISRVVEVRLDAPSPLLLAWLADPAMSVRRAGVPTLARYARKTVDRDAARPADGGETLLLVRRAMEPSPEAMPAEVRIDAVRLAGLADAVAAVKAGTLDVLVGEGLAGLNEVRVGAPRDQLRIEALRGVYGWRANALKGPLADPALRRALSDAVDREALARGFGVTAIQPEAGLLPASMRVDGAASPGPVAGDSGPPQGDAGLAEALAGALAGAAPALDRAAQAQAALLRARRAAAAAQGLAASRGETAADVPAGEGPRAELPLLVLQLLLPPGREHRLAAERVAADWRALGVTLQLREADAETRARLMARGDFDLALDETSLAMPDPMALLDRFGCGRGPHCNEAADALLAAARAAPADERPERLALVEQQLMDGPPMIPLMTAVRWAVVARGLEGWVSNPGGVHPLARMANKGR